MKISIREISQITGFSQSTVSNALNNKRGVNKDTANLIIEVARKNGYYQENKISKIRFTIFSSGGAASSTDSPFFSSMLPGAESECWSNGFEMTLSRLDMRNPEYNKILEQILADQSSAILLLATEMHEEDALVFKKSSTPVVLLDNWFTKLNLDAVIVNNTDAVGEAIQYLIDRGHKRIGYLGSQERIRNFDVRRETYRYTMMRHNLTADPRDSYYMPCSMDGSYEAMCRILDSKPDLPTAFFADSDALALGSMKALVEYGYKIPDDVSMIGFDDLDPSKIATTPLTTIRVNMHQMGQLSARRLIDLVKNKNEVAVKTHICCELIERKSVRNLLEDT